MMPLFAVRYLPMDAAQKRKVQADMFEHSYLEWNLMRSLAFGERDWILMCSVLFWLDQKRELLSWAGGIGMTLGIFFIGPIYGFFIYWLGKRIFLYRKKRGHLPKTVKDAKGITWISTIILLPFMALISWQSYDLYFQSYDSVVAWSKAPADKKQKNNIPLSRTPIYSP
jgi:hypothetical protein